MSEQIKQLFSGISPTYDKLNHLLSFNIDKGWRKKSVDKITGFSENDTPLALDLCAGTLDFTVAFKQKFSKAQVVSLDFSHPMLALGQHKIADNDFSQVSLICGDALKLPFADNTFDVLFCGYGFRNLDNSKAGLQEISRVLKPGGQLLILEFFKPESLASKTFHATYGKYLLPWVGGLISKQKKAYDYLYSSINSFLSISQCENLLKDCGFSQTRTHSFLMDVSHLVWAIKGVPS